MSPRDPMAISTRKTTDVYSVMLILAFVFLLGAIALTFKELSDHYQFWGTAAPGDVSAVEEEEVEEEATTPPPAETPAEGTSE